jgi:cell division septum initiation protein DivIVA
MTLKFASMILGENFDQLSKETTQSQKKVMLLGSVILIPTVLWFFQGIMISQIILKLNWGISITVGIVSAFLIFLIERAIVMAVSKSIWLIVFRVLLGAVIASVGSIVIDEVLFHEDINNNMDSYKQNEVQVMLDSVDAKYHGELGRLRADRDQKYKVWQKSVDEVKNEAGGTGQSKLRGVGEITNKLSELMDSQHDEYLEAKKAYHELDSIANKEEERIVADFNAGFNENSILTRLIVLHDLILKNRMAMISYIVFTLLFFILEFMVIILKMTHATTNYERKLEMIEQMGQHNLEKMLERELKSYNPAMESHRVQEAMELVGGKRSGMLKVS